MKYLIIIPLFFACKASPKPEAASRTAGVLYTSDLKPFMLDGDIITEKGLGRTFTLLAKSVSDIKVQMRLDSLKFIDLQTQFNGLQDGVVKTVLDLGNVRVKGDSVMKLITKYAMKVNLSQFDTTGNIMQIVGWSALQNDITNLKNSVKKLETPGQP